MANELPKGSIAVDAWRHMMGTHWITDVKILPSKGTLSRGCLAGLCDLGRIPGTIKDYCGGESQYKAMLWTINPVAKFEDTSGYPAPTPRTFYRKKTRARFAKGEDVLVCYRVEVDFDPIRIGEDYNRNVTDDRYQKIKEMLSKDFLTQLLPGFRFLFSQGTGNGVHAIFERNDALPIGKTERGALATYLTSRHFTDQLGGLAAVDKDPLLSLLASTRIPGSVNRKCKDEPAEGRRQRQVEVLHWGAESITKDIPQPTEKYDDSVSIPNPEFDEHIAKLGVDVPKRKPLSLSVPDLEFASRSEPRPETEPRKSQHTWRDVPIERREKQFAKYIRKNPDSIQGAKGSDALLAVCRTAASGFGLKDEPGAENLIFFWIQKYYNVEGTCDPVWNDTEVLHKIRDAINTHDESKMPLGSKLAKTVEAMNRQANANEKRRRKSSGKSSTKNSVVTPVDGGEGECPSSGTSFLWWQSMTIDEAVKDILGTAGGFVFHSPLKADRIKALLQRDIETKTGDNYKLLFEATRQEELSGAMGADKIASNVIFSESKTQTLVTYQGTVFRFRWADACYLPVIKPEFLSAVRHGIWQIGINRKAEAAGIQNKIDSLDKKEDKEKIAELKEQLKESTPITVSRSLIDNVAEMIKHDTCLPADVMGDKFACWLTPQDPTKPLRPDPKNIIVMSNGILDITTRELLPLTPELFSTSARPFEYQPNAPEPKEWKRILGEYFPNDPTAIESLQEVFGYLLTSDTSLHKVFLLLGPPRAGKSTVTKVLNQLIGSANCTTADVVTLAGQFGLQPFIGKTVCLMNEVNFNGGRDERTSLTRILSISGEDIQTIERKHEVSVTGKLPVRFILVTNNPPKVDDPSKAFANRFIIFHFTRSFLGNEDVTLKDKLTAELPGIFNWALDGLDRLRSRGKLKQPESAKVMLQDLIRSTSPITAFVEDCCEVDDKFSIPVDELFSAYQRWQQEQCGRDHTDTANKFGIDLKAAYPGVERGRRRGPGGDRIYVYTGIKLRSTSSTSDDESSGSAPPAVLDVPKEKPSLPQSPGSEFDEFHGKSAAAAEWNALKAIRL